VLFFKTKVTLNILDIKYCLSVESFVLQKRPQQNSLDQGYHLEIPF